MDVYNIKWTLALDKEKDAYRLHGIYHEGGLHASTLIDQEDIRAAAGDSFLDMVEKRKKALIEELRNMEARIAEMEE